MASIRKDPRGKSPFWRACYTDATGARIQKSTRTRNHDEAMRLALQLERTARLARRGELSESRARELISELLEQITEGRETVRAISAAKYLTDWLAGKEAHLAE